MDTLALTLAAVLLSLLIGIPLGIWAGLSDRFNRLVTPVLDFMQTMPTFVYLAPLTLFFLIGPASATIATLIYALPPAIRITAHGIRSVPRDDGRGGRRRWARPGWQPLRKVLLPMAKRTIVLGINQTIMAALSMVTIAALIDAPGPRQDRRSRRCRRSTSARRSTPAWRSWSWRSCSTGSPRRPACGSRWPAPPARPSPVAAPDPAAARLGAAVAAVRGLPVPHLPVGGRVPDRRPAAVGERHVAIGRGTHGHATGSQDATCPALTNGIKDVVTLRRCSTRSRRCSPSRRGGWSARWSSALAGGARRPSGRRVTAAVCLALLVGTGLWQDAMTTLAIDAGRHRARDGARRRRRRVDGPQRPRRPGDPARSSTPARRCRRSSTWCRSWPVRRDPVHRDRRRGRLRRPGRHQDRRRRHPRACRRRPSRRPTAAGSSTWQMITKVQLPMARAGARPSPPTRA